MTPSARVIDRSGLGALIELLWESGHTVIGPTLADEAIVFGEVRGVDDLPAGWTDEQDGGTYRLLRRDDDALFGYAVGPHSWKPYLFPPRTVLWRARRTDEGFDVADERAAAPTYAFLAVRGCDLAAIRIQDRVFLGEHPDPEYAGRRERAFVVAVNCATPAATCFCVSMGTGPGCEQGYDLALTELIEDAGTGGDQSHRFVVEVGTDRGREVLDTIDHRQAERGDVDAAATVLGDAAAAMGREMRTDDIKQLLYDNRDHPRWDDVASRCLTCANCTMVCPTCFCSTVEDTTDLTGDHAERHRVWDSCFTTDFTELAGSTVRASGRSRYRQWMTHKLATWIDQFGTSGCVGCGRCITWCPVGIDITEETRAMREHPHDAKADGHG